jgi:hypothetical protein
MDPFAGKLADGSLRTGIRCVPRMCRSGLNREVFGWVLKLLADRGLIRGQRIGIDATTLEANAAMRSIVRRDREESYDEFLSISEGVGD